MKESFAIYLCAQPSAWEGSARVLDFGATLNQYNDSLTGQLADNIALWMDWQAVGCHLTNAIRSHGQEFQQKTATATK